MNNYINNEELYKYNIFLESYDLKIKKIEDIAKYILSLIDYINKEIEIFT